MANNQNEYDVQIPHDFKARPYQLPFLREIANAVNGRSEKRYFVQLWHRRSGKDKTNIAYVAPSRLIKDPCLVKYVYPTLKMGRENLWDAIDGGGKPYMEHIPQEIMAGERNETRMTIPVRTGYVDNSLFQISGSDNPDRLRGGNAKMYIFSEWSEQNPYALDVIEPVLQENDGIAVFNFTPKGDNHARALVELAKEDPRYYLSILTAADTGIFTAEKLDSIKKGIITRFLANGRSEEEAVSYFEQEYFCSFDSSVVGAYYGAALRQLEQDGRITNVPVDPILPVHTSWDLGVDDSTSITFLQSHGSEVRVVDYYESSGEGLPHYAQVLDKKGYYYGEHYAPHDIRVRELGSGKSRLEIARSLGIKFVIAPRLPLDDGIEAVRALLPRCYFDKTKTSRLINCLKNYKKDWDEKNKTFKSRPKHDWASHGSDSLRTFAQCRRPDGGQSDEAVTNSVELDAYA